MTSVALGPNGKVVDIPDELLAEFDAGRLHRTMLYFHAVKTGQGKPEEFGLPNRDPEVSGPMQAAMISAGKEVSRLGSNLSQAMAQMGGDTQGAQAEVARQDEMQRLTAPVRQQFPKASFAGEVLPGFAIPGGKAAQIGVGAGLGALEGDTPGQRIANTLLGAGSALVGQKIGDEISQRIVPKVQRVLGSTMGAARDTLKRAGVPLTFGQRGSPVGRFVDVLKSTLLRRQPLQGQQISALNRMAAEAIGENADDLSKPVLSRAATRIGGVYEDIAQNVGAIQIGQAQAQRFLQIDDMMKTVPEPSKVTGALEMVENMLTDPAKAGLTGQTYNSLRQRLGRISNQLWNNGNGLEAEVVDEIIETLDDALEASAPEAAERLAQVRPQWKFLTALRRGAAIGSDNNINPVAMNAAMERVYKGFDIGRMPAGAAGQFGETLDAFNQVIRPFRSSGTAERLTGVGLPIAAGLGLTGLAGPVVGGGLTLATLLSGGGGGAAAGGNAAREMALKLSQMLQQQQDQR